MFYTVLMFETGSFRNSFGRGSKFVDAEVSQARHLKQSAEMNGSIYKQASVRWAH